MHSCIPINACALRPFSAVHHSTPHQPHLYGRREASTPGLQIVRERWAGIGGVPNGRQSGQDGHIDVEQAVPRRQQRRQLRKRRRAQGSTELIGHHTQTDHRSLRVFKCSRSVTFAISCSRSSSLLLQAKLANGIAGFFPCFPQPISSQMRLIITPGRALSFFCCFALLKSAAPQLYDIHAALFAENRCQEPLASPFSVRMIPTTCYANTIADGPAVSTVAGSNATAPSAPAAAAAAGPGASNASSAYSVVVSVPPAYGVTAQVEVRLYSDHCVTTTAVIKPIVGTCSVLLPSENIYAVYSLLDRSPTCNTR